MKRIIMLMAAIFMLSLTSSLYAQYTTYETNGIDKFGNTVTIVRDIATDAIVEVKNVNVNTSQYGLPANEITEEKLKGCLNNFLPDYFPTFGINNLVADGKIWREDAEGGRWAVHGHQTYKGLPIFSSRWMLFVYENGAISGIDLDREDIIDVPKLEINSIVPEISSYDAGQMAMIALKNRYEKKYNVDFDKIVYEQRVIIDTTHGRRHLDTITVEIKRKLIVEEGIKLAVYPFSNESKGSLAWDIMAGVDVGHGFDMTNCIVDAKTGAVLELRDTWVDGGNEHTIPNYTTGPVFTLDPPFPNPFNPAALITYNVPQRAEVSLKVYDLMGREVQTLASGIKDPGHYTVVFNADQLPSGVYFARLQAEGTVLVKKMILSK